MAASPGLRPASLPAAVLWIGPAVALGDATISAGLIWFGVLIGALWAGALTFGLTMTAIAMVGAWQATSVRSSTNAPRSSPGAGGASAQPTLHPSYRLPAAALAGAVGFAGVLDTRLAGAVLGAAVVASFIVVGALKPGRSGTNTLSADHSSPGPFLARAGLLVRTWMQVGVTAACAAAVARYSLGAALVFVSAAAIYDAGNHLSAAGRPPSVRGPLVGVVAAGIAIFALTGLSVPPFAPTDVIRFGLLAAVTLPLGPAIARTNTAIAARPRERLRDGADAASRSAVGRSESRLAGGLHRARQRLRGEWAVRRIDSLSVTALAWMWGLGLLNV